MFFSLQELFLTHHNPFIVHGGKPLKGFKEIYGMDLWVHTQKNFFRRLFEKPHSPS